MGFVLLIGIFVLVIVSVVWFGRPRRQFDNDPTLDQKDREDLGRRTVALT